MKNKIIDKMANYVKSNYQLLDINDFIEGQTKCNSKCHLNSVQEAINNKYNVLLCICIGNGGLFVHFINQNKNKKYIDSTLGWYGTELYDYYLVREINTAEYKDIWNVLINSKRMLININSNWVERKLKIISEKDV